MENKQKKSFFQLGYLRSNKNNEIFWKEFGKVNLYLDFKDNFFPMFYFYPKLTIDEDEKRYYHDEILKEYSHVKKNKMGGEIFFTNVSICDACNKEYIPSLIGMSDDFSLACSKECYSFVKRLNKINDLREFRKFKSKKCPICKKLPKLEDLRFPLDYNDDRHEHHINYIDGEERTVKICASCHTKITLHSDKHPDLKKYIPKGNRKEMLERKRKHKLPGVV